MTSPDNTVSDPRVAALADTLRDSEPTLDDLSRARIGARLLELGQVAAPENAVPARRQHRNTTAALVCAVAIAAGAMLVWRVVTNDTSSAAVLAADAGTANSLADIDPGNTADRVTPAPTPTGWTQLPNGSAVRFIGNTDARVKSTARSSSISFERGEIQVNGAAATSSTELHVGALAVFATNATFSAYADTSRLRLTVRVGEVWVVVAPGQARQRIVGPMTRDFPRAAAPSEPSEPSEPQIPQAKTVAPPRSVPTAEQAYRAAETAIAAGLHKRGRALLESLIRAHPTDRRADAARYDLARLAHRAGNSARAAGLLRKLLGTKRDPVVVQPAHYLLCRIYVASRDSAAMTCIKSFRAAFPRSSHDREFLAQLAGLVQRRKGCFAATPLYDEYLQRYPLGPFASRSRAARTGCRKPIR